MPKARTAAENAAHWIAQAERYERYAAKPENAAGKERHLKRAADARAHAATYTAPTP